MAIKLYVGNLPFQTTSDDLREHFAEAGNVESASIQEDRMTGRSRGFAFVEMATREEAAAAIEQLNGKEFGGRQLRVNEAKPRERRGLIARRERAYNPSWVPVVRERAVDGPEPVERTAYLGSTPIAVAYLDELQTEATLAWPLRATVALKGLLDACLTDFLPRYTQGRQNCALELWIDSNYYEVSLDSDLSIGLVWPKIEAITKGDPGAMRLLQIVLDNTVIELLFDEHQPPNPTRLAVLISVVCSDVLSGLFTRFHKNVSVRRHPEVAEQLFAPIRSSGHGNSKSLLYPLRIYYQGLPRSPQKRLRQLSAGRRPRW